MNTESKHTIQDRILSIEKELDLDSFRYRHENIWPIIRIAIYLGATKKEPPVRKPSPIKLALFLLSGVWQYLAHLLHLSGTNVCDSVLVTTSHYKISENGITYDKIINPVIQYLHSIGRTFCVWEFTSRYQYDPNISYTKELLPIQREIYFLSFLKRLTKPFRKKAKIEGDVARLNDLLRKQEIPFAVNTGFINKVESIFDYANYYQSSLSRQGAKRVFMVCYYDVKCFSILLAAHRLKLPTIDLQHGVQGARHLAYALWPAAVVKSNKFLPTHFFVWDESALNTIAGWKADASNILKGCNAWVMARARQTGNDIILVSLQPIDNFLPDHLLEMIRESNAGKTWYIRLHPRQLNAMEEVERKFSEAGLSGKVNIRDASQQSLTSLLERSVIHVTFYSSVVIEAGYYNIPTYFLGETYVSYYADALQGKEFYYYPKDDVNAVIRNRPQGDALRQQEPSNCVAVLNRFIA